MADDVLKIEIVGAELGGGGKGGGNGGGAISTNTDVGLKASKAIISGDLAMGVGMAVGLAFGNPAVGAAIGSAVGSSVKTIAAGAIGYAVGFALLGLLGGPLGMALGLVLMKVFQNSEIGKAMKSFFKEGLGAIGDMLLGVGYLVYTKLVELYDWFSGTPVGSEVIDFLGNPVKYLTEKIGEAWDDVFTNPLDYIKKLDLTSVIDTVKKFKLKDVFNFGADGSSWKVSDLVHVMANEKLKLKDVFNFGSSWWVWGLRDIISYNEDQKFRLKDIIYLPPDGKWDLVDLFTPPKLTLKFDMPDPTKAGKDIGAFINKALDNAWDNIIEKNASLLALAKFIGLSDPDSST